MRKTIALVSLSLLTVVSQAQTVIYDPVTTAPAFTFTSAAGQELAGDNFSPAAPPLGQTWQISSISLAVFFTTAGNHTVDDLRVDFFNHVDGTPASPAFLSPAGGVNLASTVLTTTAPNEGFLLQWTGLAIDLAASPVDLATGYGVQVEMLAATTTGVAAFGYVDNPTLVGGHSDGFFIDIDDNGTIDGDEFANFPGFTNGNLAITIEANPVPEPGSIIAISVGIAALAARRRRKA